MARVLIVGGGFGGVVVAESLAKKLGDEHEITLVSRSHKFLFYPSLVRLAFGDCDVEDVSFDIRNALIDRRVRFIEGEVARFDPIQQHITFARGDVVGEMSYDFLVLAMGRRLQTETITGFYEYAHHLLGVRGANKFGRASQKFDRGNAVLGYCRGARLPVPLFETAFALSRSLEERGTRDRCRITIAAAESADEMFGGVPISTALQHGLKSHGIEFNSNFSIGQVTSKAVLSNDGRRLPCDLNMIIPPFVGPGALVGAGITDDEGYVKVDSTMRATGADRTYAVGDCVSFAGPKMGHMAVRQAEVAAENLDAEIHGKALPANYDHELMLVVDAGGNESVFVQKDLWNDQEPTVQQSRFWGWAKHKQEQYWKAQHS
ncbi:MAG TPA: FAD-dependent oxidoreductase [Pyrinomonadaceae bacterium]|nr:FAD-dependent oxidoreductase [Pyrinomonadaceae bacterium]